MCEVITVHHTHEVQGTVTFLLATGPYRTTHQSSPMFGPGRAYAACGAGARRTNHQLVGECARGGADHGGLGEDDGGGDGGSVVAVDTFLL